MFPYVGTKTPGFIHWDTMAIYFQVMETPEEYIIVRTSLIYWLFSQNGYDSAIFFYKTRREIEYTDLS